MAADGTPVEVGLDGTEIRDATGSQVDVSTMPVAGSKIGGRSSPHKPTRGFVKCANRRCRYEWNAHNIFKYRCPKCRTRVKWL